jgi:hypothetical protein
MIVRLDGAQLEIKSIRDFIYLSSNVRLAKREGQTCSHQQEFLGNGGGE